MNLAAAKVPNTTIDLQDLSAGETRDVHSELVCVRPGTAHIFECTVRSATVGVWNVTWIADGTALETNSMETNGSRADEQVNLTSKYTLEVPRDGQLNIQDLSCEASGSDDAFLSVTIRLQLCNGIEH